MTTTLAEFQARTTELTDAIASILDGDLGTYTYANGSTTPAIMQDWSVSEGTQQPTVTGLEVVVVVAASIQTPKTLDGFIWATPWDVVIKQWDIAATTLEAYFKLQNGLPALGYEIDETAVRSPRRSELDSIEQVRLFVRRRCAVTL